jgi:predicted membrane protein
MNTRKPKNQNMIAKTAKVRYMYTRKPFMYLTLAVLAIMFWFFGFLVFMYLTLAVLACHVLVLWFSCITRKPKNQNMIAKTAKVRYMYTRKPKNLNMTGQNS